jgi:hypothetical protein
MSTTETSPDTEAEHGHHPTPREYVHIALVLAVLTALEVSTYFVDFGVDRDPAADRADGRQVPVRRRLVHAPEVRHQALQAG